MPRRHILTERQRKTLFDLPTDEEDLRQHYTFDNEDIEDYVNQAKKHYFALSKIKGGRPHPT